MHSHSPIHCDSFSSPSTHTQARSEEGKSYLSVFSRLIFKFDADGHSELREKQSTLKLHWCWQSHSRSQEREVWWINIKCVQVVGVSWKCRCKYEKKKSLSHADRANETRYKPGNLQTSNSNIRELILITTKLHTAGRSISLIFFISFLGFRSLDPHVKLLIILLACNLSNFIDKISLFLHLHWRYLFHVWFRVCCRYVLREFFFLFAEHIYGERENHCRKTSEINLFLLCCWSSCCCFGSLYSLFFFTIFLLSSICTPLRAPSQYSQT